MIRKLIQFLRTWRDRIQASPVQTWQEEKKPLPNKEGAMLPRLEKFLLGKYDFRYNVLTEQVEYRLKKKYPAAVKSGSASQMGKVLTALGLRRTRTSYGSFYRVVPL